MVTSEKRLKLEHLAILYNYYEFARICKNEAITRVFHLEMVSIHSEIILSYNA